VTVALVWLAVLMGAVTYPSRALPMLAPGIERLPPIVLEYLGLVGPAVLGTLAAVNVATVAGTDAQASFHVGIAWLAIGLSVAVVVWRRNLFVGLFAAVLVTAAGRSLGFD